MEFDLNNNLEQLLATLSNLFADTGCTKQVAILAESTPEIKSLSYDNYRDVTSYSFHLKIPHYLFSQIINERQNLEIEILEKISYVLTPYMENWIIERVFISPILSSDTQWRDKAKAFAEGQGINNQGRVRSDNIASKSWDGLLFRSQPEIYLYQAFKMLGVPFAPLAVFIRGGQNYSRIEPDFLIIKDGITMIVEVDGDTVHRELPAEAHARLKMLTDEGAISERILASECDTPEKAKQCASKLINTLKKRKENMK